MNYLNQEVFNEFVGQERPSMVMFGADWCGPCKMATPQVEYLAEHLKDFGIGKVDIDDNEELAKRFNVMKIPTFLFFKNGEVKDTMNGSIRRSIMEEKLKALA